MDDSMKVGLKLDCPRLTGEMANDSRLQIPNSKIWPSTTRRTSESQIFIKNQRTMCSNDLTI